MTLFRRSNLKPWSAVGIGYIVLGLVGAMFALPTAVFAAAQEKIHDIRVVVDISGSMKKSDQNNVRIPATELLVNLFPKGSRAGIWVFGQQVDRLVPLDTVDDQWKQKALRNTKKISSTSLRTNIGEALLKASVGWEKPDKRYKRSIILLTDGKVDVSADAKMNQSARERLLNSILPQLRTKGININTIALSADADSELMEKLAVATDGKFSTINSANDLLKTFVNTFDKVVPLDQVPLKGNRFAIDKSINEFTALIFTHEKAAATVLQTPSGSKYDKDQHDASVQWFHADNYDLITVSKPEAGQWLLLGESDESNRVTVVSDLKLQVAAIPVNILAGERVAIDISLLEHDKLLDKKAFLDVLSIQVSQQHVGGQQWSA
ncbi:MAG TPA: vWA domain-containing protein, partial [Pseudomonadales bacterium]|nr:vWA domain-containing protein [Pseudomonadales bacterium]